MLPVNTFPQNILAALDSLVELGKAVSKQQEIQTTVSDNPGRVTLSAVERDNNQKSSSNEQFYRRFGG